jgi:RNA polymerase sigma-70 factor (ECF subfamily)
VNFRNGFAGRALMAKHIIDDGTIEACQRGDSDAFRLVFETYKDRVYSIALGFFDGNEAAAHDITQEVFLKLMTSISQFQNRSQFSTWLYRLVTNACLDRKRALRRLFSFGTSEIDLPDRKKSIEERYIQRELESAVRRVVAHMTPKLRIAILLKYFEDLSYDEMATVLGCSKGTVASRLNRAHRILAKKLSHLRNAFESGE